MRCATTLLAGLLAGLPTTGPVGCAASAAQDQPLPTSTGQPSSGSASTADTTSSSAGDDASAVTTSGSETSSTGDATADSGSSDTGEGSTGEPPLDFDDVPWQTGDDIGYGVAYKDLGPGNGANAFIGYAGYPFPLDASQSWARELWLARLRELGVRHVWSVQGPATVGYVDLEVGNSFIAERLTEVIVDDGKVIVAGHSSGSYVAHELLRQLAGGLDPEGTTADKVIYFNLDGGTAGIDDADVQRLHRAYFVGIRDSATGTESPNLGAMQYLDSLWSARGGYLEVEGAGSGCSAGAPWCLHMVVINTLPHDPWDSSVVDYLDFDGRPVATAWLDMVAGDIDL